MKRNKCIDCGKKISHNAKARCNSCNTRNYWKIHPERKQKKYFCIDCKKELTSSGYPKRCIECYKIWQSIPENNPSFNKKGKLAFGFKHGKLCKDVIRYCKDCGKELSKHNITIRCYSCNTKHMHKEKIINTSKDKNGRWLGGISKLPYAFEFTKELKELIRKRDKYTCQLCNKSQNKELKDLKRKLSIHHINYNKQNCEEDNLITLCQKCNSKVNTERDYWYSYFLYIKNYD